MTGKRELRRSADRAHPVGRSHVPIYQGGETLGVKGAEKLDSERVEMKDKIKRYFRYQHWNTLPVYDSHENYMTCLRALEYLSDRIIEGGGMEKMWKEILEAINSLGDEDIKRLYRIVQTQKENVRERGKRNQKLNKN